MFVTDMRDLTDNKKGIVYILDEWNAETGKFGKIIPYMTGLKNPNSVQFYTDSSGQDWLYLAETHQLTRRKFTQGFLRANFSDSGLFSENNSTAYSTVASSKPSLDAASKCCLALLMS